MCAISQTFYNIIIIHQLNLQTSRTAVSLSSQQVIIGNCKATNHVDHSYASDTHSFRVY